MKDARIASSAITEALATHPLLREVRLVFFGQDDARLFVDHQVFPRPTP